MPAVSVIMPVYQAESSLEESVGSVLAQGFHDWELILIDDGSTDASPALCDRFAASDPRIRALHQPGNRGVSEARTRGLREVRGEAVAFLDADDAFVPGALETLWSLRERSGAGTAGCAHWDVSPGGGERIELLLPAGTYGPEEVRDALVRPLFGERLRAPLFNGFLWRFLFDAARIRRLGIRFEGAYLEDELFLLDYFVPPWGLGEDGRLAVTEEPLYRYRENAASATRKYMPRIMETLDRYVERKEELAAAYGLDELCPDWRDQTAWADLLIAVGNEYARGTDKSLRERQAAVEALCRREDLAGAVRRLRPEGMGRNKQVVAWLIRRRWYGLLSLLYQWKNHL